MYTLYGRKGSGSFAVEAVLAETGQKYKFIKVKYVIPCFVCFMNSVAQC